MHNISTIMSNSQNITLFLLQKERVDTSYNYTLKKCLIHNDLYQQIKELYSSSINKYFNGREECEYNVLFTEDDCIEFLHINLVPNFSQITNALDNIQEIETIDSLRESLNSTTAYCFMFTLNNRRVLTIKKVTSSYSLKNKSVFFFNDGHLNKIDSNIIAFDDKIDCLLLDDKLYILSKYNFEQIFSYNEEYVNIANTTLHSMETYNFIDNFDEFKSDCLQRSKIIKKLVILSRENLLQEFINKMNSDTNAVKETIDTFQLDVNIDIPNKKLIYDDISALSQIVNLISENYLTSIITNHNFEVKGNKKLRT